MNESLSSSKILWLAVAVAVLALGVLVFYYIASTPKEVVRDIVPAPVPNPINSQAAGIEAELRAETLNDLDAELDLIDRELGR